MSIGLANGFDAEATLDTADEADHSQWLRVWETIRFLNIWFLVLPQVSTRPLSDPQYSLDVEQPPLVSEECCNGRLVQMSMAAVSGLLREVAQDRRHLSKAASTSLYTAHLRALETWYSRSPLYLRLRTPSSEDLRIVQSGANDRQKAGILNVQSLFLGTMCELFQPALIAQLKSLPFSSHKNDLVVYAHRWYAHPPPPVRCSNPDRVSNN